MIEFWAPQAYWLDALGLALLHSLWQSSLLAVLYLLLCATLLRGSPALRVRLGELTLAACLVWPALGLLRSLDAGAAVLPLAQPAVAAVHAVLLEASAGYGNTWAQLIALAWAFGVLLLGLRAALHWQQLRQVIGSAQPVGAEWQARAVQWCSNLRIRTPVRWLESPLVDTPMMLGWVRPVVLFPLGLCMRLPAEQVELLLLHELAHIRRRDGLGNALQVVVETLLFFNPAVRWVSRRIRQDRELACDLLVGDKPARRLQYAKALLALAEQHQPGPTWAVAATGGLLGARIDLLLLGRAERNWVHGRRVLLASLLLIVGLSLASLGSRRAADLPLPITTALQLGMQRAGLAAGTDALEVRDWQVAQRTELTLPRVALDAEADAVSDADFELGNGVDLDPLALPAHPRGSAAPAAPDWNLPQPLAATTLAAQTPSLPDAAGLGASPRAAPAQDAEAAVTTAEIVRLQRPAYPANARRRGLEGWVELAFEVDAAGVPKAIRPLRGAPEGVFEQAAIEALQQWRFTPGAISGARMQRFDFSLSNAQREGGRSGACETPTGTRICRNRDNWDTEASRVTLVGMSR